MQKKKKAGAQIAKGGHNSTLGDWAPLLLSWLFRPHRLVFYSFLPNVYVRQYY